jgi:MutS domain V
LTNNELSGVKQQRDFEAKHRNFLQSPIFAPQKRITTMTDYPGRQAHFENLAQTLRKRYNVLSLARLLFFIAVVAGGFLLLSLHWSSAVLFWVSGLAAFLFLVKKHQKIQEEEAFQIRMALVNAQEQLALNYNFQAFADGSAFMDPQHPYANDLDVFGRRSFFQSINRCVSAGGKNRLAAYLAVPAEPQLIQERQAAVSELSTQLEWRQQFRACGLAQEDQAKYQRLLQEWLALPNHLHGRKSLYWILTLLPFFNIFALALILPFYPAFLGLLVLIPSVLLLRRYFSQVNEAIAQTQQAEAWLNTYASLITLVEKASFEAPMLQKLRLELAPQGDKSTSAVLRELSYYLAQLQVRNNPFAIFLNLIGLWDLQWLYKLEAWKSHWRIALPQWFEALAEIDALCSLANAYHNNPDWTFPTVAVGKELKAEQLGHPLIPHARRVGNDLQMQTQAQLKLLTGSNMAGKSTWLRTLGLNMVMAQAGAPVCAKYLEMPPLYLFTGMRTQDDLSESTSSFYAELRRLKALVDRVQGPEKVEMDVFFLLDEILKGTNSRDRHAGSRALILQLLEAGAAGFIATHDLELTAMEREKPQQIENLCMEVEIQGEELHFDYTLKKGISQSFNATLLMKGLGLGKYD